MRTENVMTPAPRDRWFALPYLIIGAVGILPALYFLGFIGLSVFDGRPLGMWFETLPRLLTFAALSSVFSAGMTLFVGYAKALRARTWPRRIMLWRATIAYNLLLSITSVILITEPSAFTAWFIGLALLALAPLHLATADARTPA